MAEPIEERTARRIRAELLSLGCADYNLRVRVAEFWHKPWVSPPGYEAAAYWGCDLVERCELFPTGQIGPHTRATPEELADELVFRVRESLMVALEKIVAEDDRRRRDVESSLRTLDARRTALAAAIKGARSADPPPSTAGKGHGR